MNRPLIIPNLHVILVHYPLGLLVTGLMIELGSFLWRRHAVRAAGRWMVLFAALSMIPAALSGAYALHDVSLMNNTAHGETWNDTRAGSPLSADQWNELVRHVLMTSIATGLVVLAVLIYVALSDRLRKALYSGILSLLIAGSGLMAVGAWFAGEAIFRLGVAVQIDTPSTTAPSVAPTTGPALQAAIDKVNVLFPPLQTHVVVAGFAVALALVSVSLSIRKITADYVTTVELSDGDSLVRSLNPPEPPPVIYPAKFWLVAMAAMIFTALLGWYFFASDAGTYQPKALWQIVMSPATDSPDGKITRQMAHVIAAGALVLLPPIMAGVAKWAPKQKIVLGVFTLLLVVAIAAQLWLGILLMFDGSGGKLTGFD